MAEDIDWYNDLLAHDGPPQQAVRADPSYAETWRGRVPDWLIRFWVEQGWGSYKNGAFWICDPAWLEPVRDEVLEGEPFLDPERTVLFAYDAFGDIFGYHAEHGPINIDFLVFDAAGYNGPDFILLAPERSPEQLFDGAFGSAFSGMDDVGMRDPDGENLLPQAIARLGRLEPGEIYGFFPALKLGGEARIENLRRVPAIEHWLLLASLGRLWLHEYYLVDPSDPFGMTSRFLRRLGPQ